MRNLLAYGHGHGGPYCYPLHVQSSPDSSCLLTMLITREGGTMVSAPKRVEDNSEASDVGVNDLGDGGAAMRALGRRCMH